MEGQCSKGLNYRTKPQRWIPWWLELIFLLQEHPSRIAPRTFQTCVEPVCCPLPPNSSTEIMPHQNLGHSFNHKKGIKETLLEKKKSDHKQSMSMLIGVNQSSNGQNHYLKTSSTLFLSLHSLLLLFLPRTTNLKQEKERPRAQKQHSQETPLSLLFFSRGYLEPQQIHHGLLTSNNVGVLKTFTFRHHFTQFSLFSQPFSSPKLASCK